MNVLITGASSGLGLGLARALLARGASVYCLMRREPPLTHERLHFARVDLADPSAIEPGLTRLLDTVRVLDQVILNAGVLSEIRDLRDTPLDAIRHAMDVNVWANKLLLDALFRSGVAVSQVVAISSGAAVSGSRGWNGYSLSKATFVMLMKLYAAELPSTHFSSVAPGLVDTAMQDVLCSADADTMRRFPTLERLAAARGTDAMPTPEALAPRLLDLFDSVREQPSGSFVDIRA